MIFKNLAEKKKKKTKPSSKTGHLTGFEKFMG
jgi:hypothetical protein